MNVEVRTPKGRVDMVIRTLTTLYVVELKLNKTADIALEQINLRNYPERFALCGLPIVKVGINLIVSGIRWGIGLSRFYVLLRITSYCSLIKMYQAYGNKGSRTGCCRIVIHRNFFSKISLAGAEIMLTWFLTKSHWLQANVKFKTN